MDNQKLMLYGGAAVLAVLLISRGRSGAAIINRTDPNAADEARASADFAARGLDSLSQVARADITGVTQRYSAEALAAAQVAAQRSRDDAYTAVGVANARAQTAAANASTAGKSGFSFGIPGIGDFGVHW